MPNINDTYVPQPMNKDMKPKKKKMPMMADPKKPCMCKEGCAGGSKCACQEGCDMGEKCMCAKLCDNIPMKKMSDDMQQRVMSLATLAPQDGDIEDREYEVLKTGDYYDPRYGQFSITDERLEELKRNFDAGALGIEVALDANHEPEKGAMAWIKSLRVATGTMYARFKDFTEEGKKAFREKIYKYFSVEYAPFTKVEDGKKTTIKNVLRGIALTNRPVIKGMNPTFFSEDLKDSFTNNTINMLKKLAEEMLKKSKVTKEDAAILKVMFDEAPAEEQAEAKADVEAVEAKAEESAAAEAKEAEHKEEEKKEEHHEEKHDEANADEVKAAEVKKFTEMTERAEKAEKLLAEAKAKEQTRVLSERVSALLLSETKEKGFAKTNEATLTSFIGQLSDEQFVQFSELMKNYVAVNITEIGSAVAGKFSSDEKVKVGGSTFAVKGADDDVAIKALAESKKLSYFEAAQLYASTNK